MSFIDEFKSAMAKRGLDTDGIQADGVVHRFKVKDDPDKSGWYILFPDGPIHAGKFGCWRRNIDEKWRSGNGESPKGPELAELQKKWRAAEEQRNKEDRERHIRFAVKAKETISKCLPANPDSTYLKKKNVGVFGSILENITGELVLPLQDSEGTIWSLQTIDQSGDKLFMPGGKVRGCFFPIALKDDGPLVVCEGYATGATIHAATGFSVVCAMNCGNLPDVTKSLRAKWPSKVIIVAADNDRKTEGNPGLTKATYAAKDNRCYLAVPEFTSDSGSDFNDLASEKGIESVRSVLNASFNSSPNSDGNSYPEWIDRYFGDSSEETIEPLTILTFDEIYALPDDPDDMLLGDNLLNKGAPLVIAGQGGVGKSRLLFQFIASCKMGLNKFLIWDIHPGAYDLKWLILQTENRKKRLKYEYNRLRKQMSEEQWAKFNSEVLCLCPSKAQDLMLGLEDPKAVKRIKMALEKFSPGAIACDPLGEFSVGDLNKDVDMRNTILTLNRTISFGNPDRCLVISHHALTGEAGIAKAVGYDRASFARNSKVLFNWTRAQINIAPMQQENNDQLAVTCGKCSDGKEFQPFCIRLNTDTLWYECDPTVDVVEWHKELKSGKKGSPAITSEKVRELCELTGSTKSELAKQIIEESGCLRPNAYRYMKAAETDGQIKWSYDRKMFFRN